MANASLLLLDSDPTGWDNPPAGKTYVGTNTSGQLVTKVHDGSPVVVGLGDPTLNQQASSSAGSITITPGSFLHTEIVTVTGAARTIPVLIAATSLPDGSACRILFNLPATAGILLELSSDVNLLWTFQNDTGGTIKAMLELTKSGSGWVMYFTTIPAFSPAS